MELDFNWSISSWGGLRRRKMISEEERTEGLVWPGYAHTMMGLKRLDSLQNCIEAVLREGVEGDLIETGVWRGGGCIFMRAVLAAWEIEDEFPADLVGSESSLETQVIEKEALVQVLRGLDQLKERDQEIISLKFAGRLRNKEIGQIIGLKEKTVSVALLRAVRRLRQEIDKEAAT